MSLGITRAENGGRDYTAEDLKIGREADQAAQEAANLERETTRDAAFQKNLPFVVRKLSWRFGIKNPTVLAFLAHEQEYGQAIALGYYSNEWDIACVLVNGQYESDEQLLCIFNQETYD